MGNIETVYQAVFSCFFAALLISYNVVWCGSYSNWIIWSNSLPWDSGYFQQEIERQVEASVSEGLSESQAWSRVPDKLAFYDYIGNNPAKGGLFVLVQWIKVMGLLSLVRTSNFPWQKGRELTVRRMPAFFEHPSNLIDKDGIIRAIFHSSCWIKIQYEQVV